LIAAWHLSHQNRTMRERDTSFLQPMETYSELLSWTYELQKFGIKFGLSSTSRLLKRLGNPHLQIKCVHIGGTNGKGSVTAMLSAILRLGGHRVGMYTSPHLVSFEERFQISGAKINQEQARKIMAEVKQAADPSEPPTFFEFTTAMAFLWFAQEQIDLAIMEVGMGGRLDATNVAQPIVSVITNISLEHQEHLGQTLIEIGREKAGIIKEKTPLVTAAVQPEVLDLFERTCQEKGSPLCLLGRDFAVDQDSNGIGYRGLSRRLDDLSIGLVGEHQKANAAEALCVMELLDRAGLPWNEMDLRQGLMNTRWPGRFQELPGLPLIILDGAHNPASAVTLVNTLKSRYKDKHVVMVLGIMKDKDIGSMLGIFLKGASEVIFSRPAYDRSADPEQLAEAASCYSLPKVAHVPLMEAIDLARCKAGQEGIVVVTGSLFTVGEAMEKLGIEA
jgi:dihydrofolate synthase / folylpolyglutamate synthase